MKFSWASAGGWTARWAAGAVLGQIVFGPTAMLFIALLAGAAIGAGTMYLLHRRTHRPPPLRRTRPVRTLRTARRWRATAASVRTRLSALASRSRRTSRVTRPAPPGPRFSPHAPKRAYSPLAPRSPSCS